MLNIYQNLDYSKETSLWRQDELQLWGLCFISALKEWSAWTEREANIDTKTTGNNLRRLQLLRNPLPCPALCLLLHGAGVELDPGEGGEAVHRRGGGGGGRRAALTHSVSPLRPQQTGTTDTLTEQSRNTLTYTDVHCSPFSPCPYCWEARVNMLQSITAAEFIKLNNHHSILV